MNYCKKCGCYIPTDAPGCLACGSKQTLEKRAEKTAVLTEQEKRRRAMREAFEEHRAASETRSALEENRGEK